MTLIASLRRLILNVTSKLRWFPPLLARLTLGEVFISSGWGKLHSLPKVTEFFASLGLPYASIQAPFVATNELVCGALVLIGLVTRLASLPIIIMMCVAILTARREDLHSADDLFGFIEYLYIVMAVYLAIEGPGPFSLDWLLGRKLFSPRDRPAQK